MDFISKVKGFFNPLSSSPSSLLLTTPQTPLLSKPEKQSSLKLILPSCLCCNVDPESKWKRTHELGGGSEAKVYLVTAGANGSKAAAKIIEMEQDEVDQLPNLLGEVSLLEKCDHENVIRVLECFFYSSRIWIIEEFCDVGAMDAILCSLRRGLTEPEANCIARQTIAALDYIHDDRTQIIHRDLKAGNLMLNSAGQVKLGDFGVAARVSQTDKTRRSFIGSSYWMAPEVIVCETDKSKGYSFPADIWSLGITLIELIEMNPPHHTMSQNRVLIRILKQDAPQLSRPQLFSANFRELLRNCLQKEAGLRKTARDLRANNHLFSSAVSDNRNDLAELIESVRKSNPSSPQNSAGELSTSDAAGLARLERTNFWMSNRERARVAKNEWAESSGEEDGANDKVSVNFDDFEFASSSVKSPAPSKSEMDCGSSACFERRPSSNVTVQSSPVDMYDVDVSEFRCKDVEAPAAVPLQHQYTPTTTTAYVVERTTFSSHIPAVHEEPSQRKPSALCLDSICSSLLYEIVEEVFGGSVPGAPSIPEAVFSVLNELADQQVSGGGGFGATTVVADSSTDSNSGTFLPSSPMTKRQAMRNEQWHLLGSTAITANEGPILAANKEISSQPFRRRREEVRHFRRQYQQQSQRLEQLKLKQTNEIKAHDQCAQTCRKTLIEKLNYAANQLHQEQRQEMQRAEHQVTNELKMESKRKRNEFEKHQKHFVNIPRNDRNITEYIDNLKAYHMARLANLDNSFTKKRHQLKRDQLEELFAFDERGLCDKYRLLAKHVKLYYESVRECMLVNQQKELEELDETNRIERQYLVDELNTQHRGFLKYMKQMKRAREYQFKQSHDNPDVSTACWMQSVQGQSIGTPVVGMNTTGQAADEKSKFKSFNEHENTRIQSEMRRREEYMRQKLDQLIATHQQKKAQLQCQQAEKRAKCCDKEAQKLAQLQRAYQVQLHDLQQFHEMERNKLKNELNQEIKSKEAFYRSTVQALTPQKPSVIKVGIPNGDRNNRVMMRLPMGNDPSEPCYHPANMNEGPQIESSQQF